MNRNGNMLTDFQRTLAFAILSLIFCAFAAGTVFFCGCTTGNDGIYINKTVWVYVTNKVDQAVEKHSSVPDADTGDGPVQEGSGGSVGTPSDGAATSGTGGSLELDFRYGGFKAKTPQEDSRCRIGKLKISDDSLSFKWESGIPSDWKRGETKKGPMIVACAFYRDGDKWVGGKFDWIDEHRASRSLENIKGGYGGWNAGAWSAAKKRGFCVVSADGKRRSNFIEQ